MTATSTIASARRAPELLGQTVVVIGRQRGHRARDDRCARGGNRRNPRRARPRSPARVALELGASIAPFDATDFERLGRFFDELPTPIDHVLVTGPGLTMPPLAEFDFERRAATSTPISCCRCRSLGTP
jgi:hypothetical protein